MKKLLLYVIISVWGVLSCEKKIEPTPPKEKPIVDSNCGIVNSEPLPAYPSMKDTAYIAVDTSFEAHLVYQGLDRDKKVNGQMSKRDALKIDTLVLYWKPNFTNVLTSLKGIEAFANMVYFQTSIVRLDLDTLNLNRSINLRQFVSSGYDGGAGIYRESFKHLLLVNCKKIQKINIAMGSVMSLNINGLQELEELHCDENPIWEGVLNASLCPKLKKVSFFGTSIQTIYVNPNANIDPPRPGSIPSDLKGYLKVCN